MADISTQLARIEGAQYGAEVRDAIAEGLELVNGSLGGLSLWKGTRAQYEALSTIDPDTVYIIKGAGS